MKIKRQVFNPYKNPTRLTGGRPDRSTGPVLGRPARSINVHRTCTKASHLGRSTARSTTESTPLSGRGRSTGRSTVGFGPVNRAVDRWLNGHKNDHWPVDRAVGRSIGQSTGGSTVRKMTVGQLTGRSTRRAILPFLDCQRADL